MLCKNPATRATRSTVLKATVLPVSSTNGVTFCCRGGATSTSAGGGATNLFSGLQTSSMASDSASRQGRPLGREALSRRDVDLYDPPRSECSDGERGVSVGLDGL